MIYEYKKKKKTIIDNIIFINTYGALNKLNMDLGISVYVWIIRLSANVYINRNTYTYITMS
jgi:hypothetical protein